MSRFTDFERINEARVTAGFFVADAIEFLGISRRTWYRWKEQNKVPKWAYSSLSIRSGDLTILGWKGFFIEHGVLYKDDLSRNYYNWTTADIMVTAFCGCHSHMYLREQRKDKQKPISISKKNVKMPTWTTVKHKSRITEIAPRKENVNLQGCIK